MKNIADIVSHYRQISSFERVTSTIKEAYLSATDYHNGNHYGALTDLTGVAALAALQRRMRQDEVGKLILAQKPRITWQVLAPLQHLDDSTFGKHYYKFMTKYDFKPEQRPLVNYVPDIELAYISQRYKQIHDFLHVLLLDEVTVHNELMIKWFEMIQLGFPSAALAALVSPLLSCISLSQLAEICRKAEKHRFVLNIYFEKHFDTPIVDFRRQLVGEK